jgi:hypothetical protein
VHRLIPGVIPGADAAAARVIALYASILQVPLYRSVGARDSLAKKHPPNIHGAPALSFWNDPKLSNLFWV